MLLYTKYTLSNSIILFLMKIIEEVVAATILFLWVIFVVTILTRKLYDWMKTCGLEDNVSIYYNRKIIHIFAGGVYAVLVPFVFTTFFFPFIMSILLTIFTYIPHKIKKIMYWFQTEENMYEVSFTIMWGTIITLGWFLSNGDFLIGVLPVLFMSIGDAVTGLVRNFLYRKRTKSWWGNIVMAIICIPIGSILGLLGIFAAVVVSIIEHYEFHPIDDNITVPLVSFILLILAKYSPIQL